MDPSRRDCLYLGRIDFAKRWTRVAGFRCRHREWELCGDVNRRHSMALLGRHCKLLCSVCCHDGDSRCNCGGPDIWLCSIHRSKEMAGTKWCSQTRLVDCPRALSSVWAGAFGPDKTARRAPGGTEREH